MRVVVICWFLLVLCDEATSIIIVAMVAGRVLGQPGPVSWRGPRVGPGSARVCMRRPRPESKHDGLNHAGCQRATPTQHNAIEPNALTRCHTFPARWSQIITAPHQLAAVVSLWCLMGGDATDNKQTGAHHHTAPKTPSAAAAQLKSKLTAADRAPADSATHSLAPGSS